MKKILFYLVFILSLSVDVFAQLKITVINVGQGDSLFIKAPNNLKILVDAGSIGDADSISGKYNPSSVVTAPLRIGNIDDASSSTDAYPNAYQNIVQVLNANGISKSTPLDYIILTHYHSDHYGFLVNIINDFGIPKVAVIDRGGFQKWSGSSLIIIPADYLNAVKSKRNPNGVLAPGAKIDLGSGAYLQLFTIGFPDEIGVPSKQVKVWGFQSITLSDDYENSKSLVFILRWNEFDMLLGGDGYKDIEPSLGNVLKREGINVDIYKIHHHASNTSSIPTFLDILMPEVSVCSVGNVPDYAHPRKTVYDNLYNHCRAFIFQTSKGVNSSLSYPVPPISYGITSHSNIKISYAGVGEYTVKMPTQEYHFKCDDRFSVDRE